MSSITDTAYNSIVLSFNTDPNYSYVDTVDNLLGPDTWSVDDIKNTIKVFEDKGYVVRTFYNSSDKNTKYKGRLWIKITRGVSGEVVVKKSDIDVYYRNHPYYAFKYEGDFNSLPKWLTSLYDCKLTGKPNSEFKIILSDDDWSLVQEEDVVVLDTVKNRISVFDSIIEFNQLFISESTIADNLANKLS